MHIQIVIPTIPGREKYLRYAIASCLHQHDNNFSILVSSNGRSPEVQKLVAENNDPRLDLVEPEKFYPMPLHWEFAVKRSQGDLIMILGDDDALLPDAIYTARKIFELYPEAYCLRSLPIQYFWPDFPIANLRNLYSPLIASKNKIEKIQTRLILKRVAEFRDWYGKLPVLYHGFVRRSLLEQIYAQQGRIFKRSSPDIYSDFMLAIFAKEYLYYDGPLSIGGQGACSNGINFALDNEVGKQFLVGLQEDMRSKYSNTSVNIEVFEYIQELLQLMDLENYRPNYCKLGCNILLEALISQKHSKTIMRDFRCIAKDHFPLQYREIFRILLSFFSVPMIRQLAYRYLERRRIQTFKKNYLDALSVHGVNNVYDLAKNLGPPKIPMIRL